MVERAPFRFVQHPHVLLGGIFAISGLAPLLLLTVYGVASGWEALGEGGHWAVAGSICLIVGGALAGLVWQEIYGDPRLEGGVRTSAGIGPFVLQSRGIAAVVLDTVRVTELREGVDDVRWLVAAVGPDDVEIELLDSVDGTEAMRIGRGLATTMGFALEVHERGRDVVRIEGRAEAG